jgi:ribonuclease P protein component
VGSERFPRAARLTAPAQFDRAFADGARRQSVLFRLHCLANGTPLARLGFAVSRKYSLHATERNRVRRHAREAFRRARSVLAGWDLVLVPKPAARTAQGNALQADLAALFARMPALNPRDPVGTMARSAGNEVPES